MYRRVDRLDGVVWALAAVYAAALILVRLGAPAGGLLPLLLISGLAAALMSRMTTEVRDGEFTVSLGPGWLATRIPTRSITRIDRVELQPWQGYGLRLGPGRLLYRLWGDEGLQLTLSGGRVLTVTSTDLDGLTQALHAG